ncbi:hypothetical protein L226DRAFT_473347 [Lentinus tigrinus ALCF2SS1-7]|uniref:Uncharacterized protein n=1 Tax=Lentinus tigrinus ALCF2SS1-6 TaxID=1328759 RepID=A0A5C2RS96_9APHY|nr:hypothetical protein L227DRAFT_589385 [Lentinus tigrinus ALCF2SS1-6]RPD68473.1 hypothetical protein L226DRAFT_473347 [Lentinus tigrinus ALCF2SS1-7]
MPNPDLLTYRYNGHMVYVTPAKSYEQGIEFAQSVFPELASIEPEHISICVNGCVQRQRTLIRIGPMAWASVVPTLARYEVLEVIIKNPEIVVDSVDPADADGLPNYEDVKEKTGSSDFLAPSRGPSPHKKFIPLPEMQRIAEKNAARSRSPSPATSRPSSASSSSISDWAKSLFGKKAE